MDKKIVVIGHANMGKTVFAQVSEKLKDEGIEIINDEGPVFPITNTYANLPEINMGKQFKCKGKHEYRLVNQTKETYRNGDIIREIWQCQCGKKLGG